MTLDEKKDGDAVLERDGMHFFVDAESVPYLRGATLDFSGGLTGTGFRIVNPNASRTCGCGSSFETTQSARNQGVFSRRPDGLWVIMGFIHTTSHTLVQDDGSIILPGRLPFCF